MGQTPAVKMLNAKLTAWYSRCKRDLPWRRTADPYAIWISEIMLQQTQVDTVIPYYERFLARFPTVADLADASSDDLLKMWENLGYYARARHLRAAAVEIVNTHGGVLPDSPAALGALPGIGPYTTGAILSIAFGHRVPAVDGNAKRVLARIYAVDTPIERPDTVRAVHETAARLVPKKNPGDWNQAVMDLGARVCLPKHPRCAECPIREDCLALSRNLQGALPVRGRRKKTPQRDVVAAVLRDSQGRVLVTQRPETGLLGGLWKFPGGTCNPGETPVAGVVRTVKDEVGLTVRERGSLVEVAHAYTHFRITLHARIGEVIAGRPRALGCARLRWVAVDRLSRLAFSKADRRVAEHLLKHLVKENK